jgi:hypothetical protein
MHDAAASGALGGSSPTANLVSGNTESKERFPTLAEVQPSRRSAEIEPLGSKGEDHEHCQKIGGVCGDGLGREGLVKRGATANRNASGDRVVAGKRQRIPPIAFV